MFVRCRYRNCDHNTGHKGYPREFGEITPTSRDNGYPFLSNLNLTIQFTFPYPYTQVPRDVKPVLLRAAYPSYPFPSPIGKNATKSRPDMHLRYRPFGLLREPTKHWNLITIITKKKRGLGAVEKAFPDIMILESQLQRKRSSTDITLFCVSTSSVIYI